MQGSVIIAPIRRTSNISKSNDTKHFRQHEVQKSHQDTPLKYSDDGFPAPSKLCPDAPEALSYQVRLNQKKKNIAERFQTNISGLLLLKTFLPT